MAEALVIVGLVGNIFQFLQVAGVVLKESKEIYDSADSISKRLSDLQNLVDEVTRRRKIVQDSPSTFYEGDRCIKDCALECEALEAEVEDLVKSMQFGSKRSFGRVRSLLSAIKTRNHDSEIQRLEHKLRDITYKIQALVSDLLDQKRHSTVMTAIDGIKSMGVNVNSKLDDLADTLRRIATSGVDVELYQRSFQLFVDEFDQSFRQRKFLKSLAFSTMKQRHSDISKAFDHTLDWVFDRDRTNLLKWLEEGSGCFWIHGIPGCGKSTMMKFIADNETTKNALQKWASGSRLVTSSFYFYSQGYTFEKTKVGLLKSLIFQILKSDTSILSELNTSQNRLEPWCFDELYLLFEEVLNLYSSDRKFCFFFDGLDEYEGDVNELLNIIKRCEENSKLKICAASRNWPEFIRFFKDSTNSIVVEEHTQRDMEKYIHTSLSQSPAFISMIQKDPRCSQIITKIRQMVKGVWIWLDLVVKDIRRDLEAEENFENLMRRVNQMPKTLEGFYIRLIERLDPLHKEETSRILLNMLTYPRLTRLHYGMPLIATTCIESEMRNSNYAIELTEMDMSLLEHHVIASKRISARCGNLIRIRESFNRLHVWDDELVFIHKTLADFLQDKYLSKLREDAGDFNSELSVYRISLWLLKRHWPSSGQIDRNLAAFLRSVRNPSIEFLSSAKYYEILNQVPIHFGDHLMSLSIDQDLHEWLQPVLKTIHGDIRLSKLAFAVQSVMPFYMKAIWEDGMNSEFCSKGMPLLAFPLLLFLGPRQDVAWRNIRRWDLFPLHLDKDTISHLLKLGCSPNDKIIFQDHNNGKPASRSVGVDFLDIILKSHRCRSMEVVLREPMSREEQLGIAWKERFENIEQLYDVTRLLFQNGLSLPANGENTTLSTFSEKFEPILGTDRVKELLQLHERNHQPESLLSKVREWLYIY